MSVKPIRVNPLMAVITFTHRKSTRSALRKTQYHRGALDEMPVVAENRISLQGCIDEAIREAVLFAVKSNGTEQKSEGDENSK